MFHLLKFWSLVCRNGMTFVYAFVILYEIAFEKFTIYMDRMDDYMSIWYGQLTAIKAVLRLIDSNICRYVVIKYLTVLYFCMAVINGGWMKLWIWFVFRKDSYTVYFRGSSISDRISVNFFFKDWYEEAPY